MARLDVITGSMFCGKTEELIRRLNRAIHANKKVLVIKPQVDTRAKREIAARRKKRKEDTSFEACEKFEAHPVNSFADIRDLVHKFNPDILAIDETQFFLESWIVDCIKELLDMKEGSDFSIIVSGLDTDYLQKPFGQMPNLMAIADTVTKLSAICFKCKKEAVLTYRKPGSPTEQVVVGDFEMYEARCRSCHKLPD
ncbi:MAG: thymidine kinase [bacterium]|nr:thymidine kinase [bacterium]